MSHPITAPPEAWRAMEYWYTLPATERLAWDGAARCVCLATERAARLFVDQFPSWLVHYRRTGDSLRPIVQSQC